MAFYLLDSQSIKELDISEQNIIYASVVQLN